MDDGRKILPFDAQRLYPMPPAAFNDVRLTSGGQSGACTDLLGRPSPLTPVDFMATLQGPYNYMVPPHGWGIPAAYLGPQQQKHSSSHSIHHQQRIGGNLNLGTSGIYPDAINPFYGVPQRNLWGPCFPNQLDPAILASYWLQQHHHHQQQQQQQQQQHHHQQQQQQLSQHFSNHLQPPRCDIDDCRRERRHRDRRPKSAVPNRPGEEEYDDEEAAESGQRKVVETSEKRPNRSQRSLSRNRTNNNNNNNNNTINNNNNNTINNNKSGYQDSINNISPSNGGRCRLRHDIKEDVDDDVAIVGVEGGASTASTTAQQRLKLEAATIAVAKVPSSLATTTTTRISASPDTTTLTSSFLGAASTTKVGDVADHGQRTTTFDDVKSELDLGYHHHYHDLGDHPRSPHHRFLTPTFKTEPENQFRGSKNSLSSKNSFGSNFRISDLISVNTTSPLRGVKMEDRDLADSGGFKNDKSIIPSPTDSKPFIHDLQSQLGVPGFESQSEVMDFSSGRRSQVGFASVEVNQSSIGAIKCEENVGSPTASTTVAMTSSASLAAAAAAFDVKVEEVGLSPRESKQHRSSLLSDLEKNLGSFHKSQKLSLETPDSVSCVSLSCHMGEYRVSHQKSGHRVGKVHAPTYLPEIGQPDTLSSTQNGAATTTTISAASASALLPSPSASDVLSAGVIIRSQSKGRRLLTTSKKRKKSSSSSSSSSSSLRIASSSPSLSPVAKATAKRTPTPTSDVNRQIVAAGILGDVHLKLESTDHHEAVSNPAPRHDSSSPFDRTADDSTLFMDAIPCCYRPGDVGVRDCHSHYDARQLECHQSLVGSSGCLPSRPGRPSGHCAKSFSTANSPSVPVGVARALQRSCNSGGGGCWRGSSSLPSTCSNHQVVRCSVKTKDYPLLHVNVNPGEDTKFLNRTTPPHPSSSSSSSSSLLNPSGYKSSFSSQNLFHPQAPHASPPHCSLEHHNHFLAGLLHDDLLHLDSGGDDVVGSCGSHGNDVHLDAVVMSLVPGKDSKSEAHDGFSPLDLTKNKDRVNPEAEASATADASATSTSDSLPITSLKLTGGESCATSHSLNSGKFCLCCCPCCCLFKSRILSKACSHLFASPSSSQPSLQASLATTLSPHLNQSNGKFVSTESRATSPMEWSPSFQASDSGKSLRDSETQTESIPKSSIPPLATPFQVAPTHQSFLASSSSTLSYADAEEMRTSVDGADEVFDFGGLSILSSVAEAAGQLPRTTPATGRLSILDIPVSVFMELPETPPAVVECQGTPVAELPPSPDLTLNYNVPRSSIFFRPSAAAGLADGDNQLQQLQRHFNDPLASNHGEMNTVVEAVGMAGEMLDNEVYLRKKLEEVKSLYQQNKKEVAKLERLSSQKAKSKKQRKDHPATSTAPASTTTASSSSVAKSRHVPGHKASSNAPSRHDTVATSTTSSTTQTSVSPESLATTVSSTASLLRVSLSAVASPTTPSPVVTPTAPILTSASLDPVQVKGGGSDEPPMLSFSGVVSSCRGVEAQVKLERADHVMECCAEVTVGSVQSKPPKKKRKSSNSSSTGKENQRGRSVSDVKSEENEASDPERDWLFRRRSERIFLHQPFMTPIAKVKEEIQPMSEDAPMDKDQKPADDSDLRFHDIKTLPLSPLSLPPVPITEDNNNTFIKDVYNNNNNNIEGTDSLFHIELPESLTLPVLIGSLNSPPEFPSNPQPNDDLPTVEVPKVELEANFDPTRVKNEDLVDGLKVLYLREQCFVEATVRNISPPDIYGVVVDRDRSRRPDILSLEELLSKIVRVVQPASREQLPTGSRVCVLWSGRSNSFYPGTVLEDDQEEEDGLESRKSEVLHDTEEKRSASAGNKDVQLNIDFDDGDSGWFPLEQIRMLPSNFPLQKVEMSLDSVLAASRKKRSSSSQAEYGTPSKISKKRSEGDVATSKTSKTQDGLIDHPLPKEFHKVPKNESRLQKAKTKDSQLRSPASNPNEKSDQRAKNSQLLEKFHEKMTKVRHDVTSGIDAFKKKENKLHSDAPKKKEQSPTKVVFEERSGFKFKREADVKSSAGMKQKFEQKKDNFSQRGSHFQNIFEEMKKLKSEERGPKLFGDPSTRDPLTRSLPLTESNPKKNSSFFSSLEKDVERVNKKESAGILKQPDDKNKKKAKESKKTRKTSRKESESSGNEDCTSEGTSGSIWKKRKQSTSSCSEPACMEKSNKIPKSPQTSHSVCSSASQASVAAVPANATATTAVPGLDLNPSLSTKCKRSCSPEKYEEAVVEVPAWQWYGAGVKRQGIKGKSRKTFYKAIKRGNEIVEVGNSVVFLSNGKSKFKFVGCVESFWENPDGSKSVKVKWYYHPEETRGGANQIQFTWRALFQSSHEDENDLQTISHKCQILSFKDFKNLLGNTTTDKTSPFKQSSAAQQLSTTQSPFLPSIPTATPSFSITPFTSNLSTLKQNSSIRSGYLMGSGSASGSSGGPAVVPGGCNLPCEVYYLAGTYEPTRNYIWFEPGVPLLKDRDRFLAPTTMSTALPMVAASNVVANNNNNDDDDDGVGGH